jgi:hypothetical protein
MISNIFLFRMCQLVPLRPGEHGRRRGGAAAGGRSAQDRRGAHAAHRVRALRLAPGLALGRHGGGCTSCNPIEHVLVEEPKVTAARTLVIILKDTARPVTKNNRGKSDKKQKYLLVCLSACLFVCLL